MNENIKEYLNYYISLQNPQYAVLLKGSWGCGKTYFIKKMVEEWNPKEDNKDHNENKDKIILKPIYVSLNGISEIKIVNEKIRAEITPWLYSKGANIIKGIARGLLKTTLRINFDLDEDQKNDGNISYNIDPVKILNLSNKDIKGERILIFDDIERCKVPTDNIFGYINNFVEHSKCKVILLADEDKIKKKYDSNSSQNDIKNDIIYKDFKEKLIGQTFEIKSAAKDAIEYFIKEIIGEEYDGKNKEINKFNEVKKSYKNNIALIQELFEASELNNLRVLRQTLIDFKRFIGFIGDEIKEHKNYQEFIKNILAYFLIVSMEYKTGNDEIKKYQEYQQADNSDENNDKYKKTLERFKCYHLTEVFTIELIIEYIEKGTISIGKLNEKILSNIFFSKNEEQDWEKLWYWQWGSLEDKEFEKLKSKVWQEFDSEEFKEPLIILHTSGIFLSLIDNNFLNKKKEIIVSKAKKNIEKIFTNNPQNSNFEYLYSFYSAAIETYKSKNFHSSSSKDFKKIKNFIQEKNNYFQQIRYQEYIDNLFEEFTDKSIETLYSDLGKICPNKLNPYLNTAIFGNINGEELGRNVKSLTNQSIKRFHSFIVNRYLTVKSFHKGELKFLKDFKKELEIETANDTPLKNYFLKEFSKELSEIIKKIENEIEKN